MANFDDIDINQILERRRRNPNKIQKVNLGAKPANSSELDMIFNKGKDISKTIAKEVGPNTTARAVAKEGISFMPIVGDLWDVYRGTTQAFNGHPIVGTSQALLGVAGLGGNLLAPGVGSAIKAGVKVPKAIKTVAKASKGIRAINNKGNVQTAKALTPELFYLFGGNKNNSNQPKVDDITGTIPYIAGTNKINKQPTNVTSPQYVGGQGSDGINDIIQAYYQNNGQPTNEGQRVEIPQEQTDVITEGAVSEDIPNDKLQLLLDFYNKQQQNLDPYRKDLEAYINNYNNYARQKFNMDRYLAGIAGWSGNQNFGRMIGNYDPAEVEEKRLALMNKLAQEKSEEIAGPSRLIGNAYIAQAAGLPIEAALGDKDVFKAISPIMSSLNTLRGRRYTADTNLERTKLANDVKMKIANLNNNRAMQIALGTWNTQKEIAHNRDITNLQRAMITSIGMGADPHELANYANALGATNINIEQLNKLLNND